MKNQILKELYSEKFKELASELFDYNSTVKRAKKATNPFLLKVPNGYEDFKNKIMIFGQETNIWCGECGESGEFSNNIEKSLQVYENFYLEGGFNKDRGPFWNEFKRVRNAIINATNSIVIWNNLNKIGTVGKGNLNAINKIQFEKFKLLREEYELLKPNIVVFFTGNNYNKFIEENFGSFDQIEIIDSLHKLDFKGNFKGTKFFKTFHPNAFYYKKKNKIVIPELIKVIKESCI